MNKKIFGVAGLIFLIALVLNIQMVLAYERVTVGDYEIEICGAEIAAADGGMSNNFGKVIFFRGMGGAFRNAFHTSLCSGNAIDSMVS